MKCEKNNLGKASANYSNMKNGINNVWLAKKVMSFLVAAFILFSLVVPTLFINKIIFVLIIAFYFYHIIFNKIDLVTYVPFLILGIFLFGFFQGILLGCDINLAVQFLLSVSLLFVIYPIVSFKINMESIIKKVSVIYIFVCCFYILFGLNQRQFNLPAWLLSFAKPFNEGLFNTLGNFIHTYGLGAIGSRSFFGNSGNCMIHLGSVPFMLLPMGIYAYDLFNNRNKNNKEIKNIGRRKLKAFLFLVIGFLVSLSSTSRALIICEIVEIVLAFIVNCRRSVYPFVILISVSLCVVLLAYLFLGTTMFSFEEQSNSIKIGHIKGYFANLNLKNFLIGDGLASYYHSFAYEGLHAHTEITLLDFVRYFGVIPAFAIYVMLFLPKLNKSRGYKRNLFNTLIFTLYLIISLTNPVLFNSIGMSVILWYWADIINKKSNTESKQAIIHA